MPASFPFLLTIQTWISLSTLLLPWWWYQLKRLLQSHNFLFAYLLSCEILGTSSTLQCSAVFFYIYSLLPIFSHSPIDLHLDQLRNSNSTSSSLRCLALGLISRSRSICSKSSHIITIYVILTCIEPSFRAFTWPYTSLLSSDKSSFSTSLGLLLFFCICYSLWASHLS